MLLLQVRVAISRKIKYMKYLKLLPAFLALILLISGCRKEYSIENRSLNNTITSKWEFREDSLQFSGPVDTAFTDTLNNFVVLSIEGTSLNGNEHINLQLMTSMLKTGTYKTPFCSFIYHTSSGVVVFQNDMSATDQFSITITAIDSLGVTGTFSGQVKDASGKVKTITAGKFSAKLKRSTTSLSGNCKITDFIVHDSATGTAVYSATTTYSGNIVSNISLINKITSAVNKSFPVIYSTGRVQLDSKQYFLTDGSGRPTVFYGFADPSSDTSMAIIARYTYNASGQLAKRTEENASNPGIVVYEMDYTYTGSLLTKTVLKYGPALTPALEVLYEYDAAKPVKNFLYWHAYAPEITFFQFAVNFGVNSDRALVKATEHVLDPISGNVTARYVSVFHNYLVDANGYVQQFYISGNNFQAVGLPAGAKYTLSYKCF
jgi:hypothetical protein